MNILDKIASDAIEFMNDDYEKEEAIIQAIEDNTITYADVADAILMVMPEMLMDVLNDDTFMDALFEDVNEDVERLKN